MPEVCDNQIGLAWLLSRQASTTQGSTDSLCDLLQKELKLDMSTVLVNSNRVQIDGFTCGWHVCGELQVPLEAIYLHLHPL